MNEGMISITNPSPHRQTTNTPSHGPVARTMSETMDVDSKIVSPLIVRLVVGHGTHAGVTADIRDGIYMIGRDRECQIRPKSQSVSDRHCLVQHHAGSVRVFDLDSEEGTFVNDEQLVPKTWRLLNHGDRLRCGKYWFDVAVYIRELESELDQFSDCTDQNLLISESIVEEVAEADIFDDENFSNSNAFDSHGQDEELQKANSELQTAVPAVAKAKKKSRLQLPKPKIHSSSSRSIPLSFSLGGADTWKIVLATLMMLSVGGYLGWTVYQVQKGPPVKILPGID